MAEALLRTTYELTFCTIVYCLAECVGMGEIDLRERIVLFLSVISFLLMDSNSRLLLRLV